MTTWARLINRHALDVVTTDPATLFTPEAQIHPAPFEVVPDGTVTGSVHNQDGTWTQPATPDNPDPVPTYADIPPAQFYLCFTVAEAVAIKAYAASKNAGAAEVGEFLVRLQMWIDQGQAVVPTSTAVTNGLAGLVGLGLLDSARIPAILSGEQQ